MWYETTLILLPYPNTNRHNITEPFEKAELITTSKQSSLRKGNPWVGTLCDSFIWCQTFQKDLSLYHIDTLNTFQLEQSGTKRTAQKEGNCNMTTTWIGKTQHAKWESVIMIIWTLTDVYLEAYAFKRFWRLVSLQNCPHRSCYSQINEKCKTLAHSSTMQILRLPCYAIIYF